MSSPPRRRHKGAPMEEIQGTVCTKRQRLPELDSPPAANKGLRASSAETEDQTCGEDDICQGALRTSQGLPELDKLPEDMLQHIHSLLPLQDAARAACVSRRFMRSWRCYSNLTLNRETVGVNDYTSEGSEMRYINKIDQILNNYAGNLKSLDLYFVHITEEGLNQLLSKSSGLERLRIDKCSEGICLKIPCMLQKLKSLTVKDWHKMQGVEISAPNLSTFHYNGFPLEINIRDPSQLKYVYLASFEPSRILSYGAKRPSIARNDERLTLLSRGENVNTAMRPDKLLHLKILEIKLCRSRRSPMYDIFSLGSFLCAFPALESFILHAERDDIIHNCVAGDDAYLMGESAYQHDHLKRVKITGFHSDKGLIKLAIHILESAPSLESLTLDTTRGYGRKPGDTSKCVTLGVSGKCCWMSQRDLEDSAKTVEAAGRYIVGRVPPAVVFKLLEPCSRCYTCNQ